MSDIKILSVVTIILTVLIVSCESNSPLNPDPESNPVGDFSLSTPQNESSVFYAQPLLTWEEAENSDNTDITYEVRLGKNNPPEQIIASELTRPEYKPEIDYDRSSTYYWQIIASTNTGEATKSREVFSFSFAKGSGLIASDDLEMPLRYRHSLEVFDGKLWMFAGHTGGHHENDIWYSEDGIEWTKAVDFSDFPPRFSHTSLVYDDKMWVIAGTVVGGFYSDVWKTEDGIRWTEVTNSAPFGWRNEHSSVVFDNKIWIIGGVEVDKEEHTAEIHNDIWYSSDGKYWTKATDNADFQPRGNHESFVFDNKMWVIGGFGSEKYLKDVWYSHNGVDWTLATENIGIPDISGYESIVYDEKIWLIGGTPDGGGVSGEIWYSSDGTNWENATPFFGRVDHAVTVFQDKIWGVGGLSYDSDPSDINDSWYLNVP